MMFLHVVSLVVALLSCWVIIRILGFIGRLITWLLEVLTWLGRI